MKDKIIILVGPTAVGKTHFAINLAQIFNGEIVSADSMQIYKFMNIGSAKPSREELQSVKHYLIDEIDPREGFSVSDYQRTAKAAIGCILRQDKTPIISGGTGLYVNSLIHDMDFSVIPSNDSFRLALENEALILGKEAVHQRLRCIDLKLAERIHPNNLRKVIRALEVYHNSGEAIKSFEESFVKTNDYDYILIGLTRNREELYNRINQRVDELMAKGLVEEVHSLMHLGLTDLSVSMKGIGYKEIINCLNGDYDLERAVDLIKQNTRHYAKRQMTWFKRYSDIRWFNLSDYQSEHESIQEVQKWIVEKSEFTIKPINPII